MILPLRQRHRRMFAVIGIVIPIAFAVGIAARKPVPSVARLPAGLVKVTSRYSVVEWERLDLFAKSPVQVRLLRESPNTVHLAVGFHAEKDFVKPDLLVYWVAGNAEITDKLPDDVILLGGFAAPAPLTLPSEVVVTGGSLILFNLADQEIVDVSRPFKFVSVKQ